MNNINSGRGFLCKVFMNENNVHFNSESTILRKRECLGIEPSSHNFKCDISFEGCGKHQQINHSQNKHIKYQIMQKIKLKNIIKLQKLLVNNQIIQN